jgi:Mg-chelatase subunit ChlD
MEEKVSLVTYADTALVDDNLTFTYTNLIASIDAYSQSYDGGSTNIADGILKGRQTLMDSTYGRSWASKTIVVMTDGNHNAGSISPVQAAQDAATLGIIVHTITYGNDADQAAMQAVANAGGGEHWHAPNGAALNDVFREIAANLPTMLME